jgi:hypothetical protein
MSDKLNGIFDSGFSGIIHEGKRRSTMPNFLEQLAEKEAQIFEGEVTPINLDFEANIGSMLTRASDLSNSDSRIVESRKVESKDYKGDIDSMVQSLLSEGQEPVDIEKTLNRKFPSDQIKRYFEANARSILKKYAELGIAYINTHSYKIAK